MLPVVTTIEEVRHLVELAKGSGQVVGLVPTMGALHEGHDRLVETCRAEAGFVVVSIFVNPAQFGPREDFTRYPRTLELDRERCAQGGADLIFAPDALTMYPRGPAATFVEVPGLSDLLEGTSRPGHFRGVATVVLKLFEIVGPRLAYFGAKDYQQQLIVRRMVADLDLPVVVRTIATFREPDGLALSSRNRYLNPDERRAAAVLWRALAHARQAVLAGECAADRVRQNLRAMVQSEGLARLDYAEVADAETLEPLTDLASGRRAVALLAAWVGTTRLIDNAILTE